MSRYGITAAKFNTPLRPCFGMRHHFLRVWGVLLLLLAAFWGRATYAKVAAPPKAIAGTINIIAFGDSLTAGYGLAPGESFPAQLQAALQKRGHSVRVHNAGVSGDTTTGGKARLDWVLGAQKQKPDLVIVELGANDSLRGINPAITRANLDAILTRLKPRTGRIIVAGMLAPPNMGKDYARDYNSIFPALAKKHGSDLYPFFMDGVVLNARLKLDDGMHPNKAGVAVIVQRILPLVEKNIVAARAASAKAK